MTITHQTMTITTTIQTYIGTNYDYDYGPYEYQYNNHVPYEFPYESDPQHHGPSPHQAIESPQPSTSQKEQDFPNSRHNDEPK